MESGEKGRDVRRRGAGQKPSRLPRQGRWPGLAPPSSSTADLLPEVRKPGERLSPQARAASASERAVQQALRASPQMYWRQGEGRRQHGPGSHGCSRSTPVTGRGDMADAPAFSRTAAPEMESIPNVGQALKGRGPCRGWLLRRAAPISGTVLKGRVGPPVSGCPARLLPTRLTRRLEVSGKGPPNARTYLEKAGCL